MLIYDRWSRDENNLILISQEWSGEGWIVEKNVNGIKHSKLDS